MALELEHRHQGKLGLEVVPVGLTYSAKEIYRSDALVHFGEPIVAADFLPGYAEHPCSVAVLQRVDRKECIRNLLGQAPDCYCAGSQA